MDAHLCLTVAYYWINTIMQWMLCLTGSQNWQIHGNVVHVIWNTYSRAAGDFLDRQFSAQSDSWTGQIQMIWDRIYLYILDTDNKFWLALHVVDITDRSSVPTNKHTRLTVFWVTVAQQIPNFKTIGMVPWSDPGRVQFSQAVRHTLVPVVCRQDESFIDYGMNH